jgi:amino acid adenylation domain-containing protein
MTPREDDRRAELLARAIRLKKAAARSQPPELPPRPADQQARLGEMQRSLWLTHQMEPASPAYNLTSAFRAHGPIHRTELQRALHRVVDRHRILRSTFSRQRDTILQIVHADLPPDFEVVEVAKGNGLSAAARKAREAFDLETGPLIRLHLVEEDSGGDTYLVLVLHHILADERSLEHFWNELAEAYAGRLPDDEPDLQYDDYVYWQNQRDPQERGRALQDWRRRLDPLPDELSLPFERVGTDAEKGQGRLLRRILDPSVQRGIRQLASSTAGTPFTVYAFSFRLLLQRYVPGRRFAFAVPVSTRSHHATDGMIGYFTNPVVISAGIEEERPVVAAVSDFSGASREALAQASVPFDELTEALSPPRHGDRHPIFQAMFVYQQRPSSPPLGEARLEPVALDLGAAKFDLTLFVTEAESGLEIGVEYREDRFDEIWMAQLLDHYETLLQQLPLQPERSTAEVPMLADQEGQRLRTFAEGAPLETGEMPLLPERFLQQARRSPQSPALVCEGVRRTYGELESSALSIASELASRGVAVGDRVGVFLGRSVQMIEAVVGTHLSGAAYVPLDPSYPEARHRQVLEDAAVSAVLTSSTLRSRLPDGSWSVIEVDALDEAAPRADALPVAPPESPAYLLYTSGSTGRPKGVVVTHANLRASTAARVPAYELQPQRFLLLPSLAFDSSVAGIFWALWLGGCLVIPAEDEARDPRRLTQLIDEERVDSLLCVPSLYAQLLRTGADRLQGLQTAIVAGESCPSALVEEHFQLLPRTRLFNEYGPTEATVWATVHEITREDRARPVAIGRPIPGVRVDVLDPLGRPAPTGVPGEAWIRGATVASGYWRRPELSDACFVVDARSKSSTPSYRTGDRVRWSADGSLLFLGREDEQIKLRGFRIEPGEVEAALLEFPEIEEAAVVGRSIDSGRAAGSTVGATNLLAFVEPVAAETVTNWREGLAKRLPEHMIPDRLVVLPELPRLPNGKIDRQQLKNREVEAEAPAKVDRPILTTQVQALLSLWEGLLERSGIELDDNFFELGGHSLLVVELTMAIEQDFGVSLSVAEVFQNPTVRQLALCIAERGAATASSYQHLFPIQTMGRKDPFIVAVPHFFTEMFAARFRNERPVYGLRGVGLRPEGNLGRWRTMAELGEDLVEEIERRFPDSTCILAGYSFGASMAFETARILEERGHPAQRLYLIAPMPVNLFALGPLRLQLDGLREPVNDLSVAEALRLYARGNSPWTRQPYRRLWRRLAIEPWRRWLCGVGRVRRLLGRPLTERILYADVRVDRFRLHAAYRPQPIQTPTVIFNAQEAETDAAETWRPYCKGPLTVHPTPDPHLGEASAEAARQVILRHLRDLGES